MSIIGNASLNRVVKTLTNFDVYFNISAESTSNLVQYEIFLDDVSQGITPISPIKQTGLITVNTFASNIGYHTFGVLFTNASGESEYFTQTIYLDHTNPVLHNFSLASISRNENRDFTLFFNVHLSDETGISRLKLINTNNGQTSQIFTDYSTDDYNGTVSITLPFSYAGTAKSIRLEYEDYSGNIGVSAPKTVVLNNLGPTITSAFIKKVEKTISEYLITLSISINQASYQTTKFYSLLLNDISPVWIPINVIGTSATFEKTLTVPINEPAGNKTIYFQIMDDFKNVSIKSIPFLLDKTDPEGYIRLNYAEKIGSNYYANVKFYATDASAVLGYGYQLDNSNLLNWNYTNTPSQIFETNEIIPLGMEGGHVVYGQYTDTSGNLSPVYVLNLDIDTINPDCNFEFVGSELNANNDYVAKFHLIATDNSEIQFIKLYGINSNTNNYVFGHSNTWTGITGTKEYDEIKEIVIHKNEQEDNLIFHFQARDSYGNESPLRTANVIFDKTKPTINVFEFEDTLKTTTYHRIFMKTNVVDNKGIAGFRKHFDDITYGDWIPIEPTKTFNQSVSLDIPTTDIGVLKQFKFQVRDIFGNESNIVSFPIQLDEKGPLGSFSFAGAALDPQNYILDFQLDATDQGTSNVHFYSIVADDSTTKNWKALANSAPTISEVVSYNFPRTNDGIHTFYLRFADMYKNESPVYQLDYDLDSITIVGGIELSEIVKTPASYYANLHLYAFDNKGVDSYSLNGGSFQKVDPSNSFNDYLVKPIGLTAGARTFRVQYKDTFENLSNVYSITFDLDNQNPTANLFANGISANATHYNLNLRLEAFDNYELQKYKFWYSPTGEPNNWIDFPTGRNYFEIQDTFVVPKTDTLPTFEWKVVDFFQNEIYGSGVKNVVTTPPGPVTLSVYNTQYNLNDTDVTIKYDVKAAANSTIDKLKIIVNKTSPSVQLDEFEFDVPNQTNAIGTFNYSFAKNVTYAKFDVYAISDYGFNGPSTSITHPFDNFGPTANASFVGAFEDNYDYILQFHITGSDINSGLSYIKVDVDSFPLTKTFYFNIPYTNTVDDIFNVRIDQTHTSNYATANVTIYDMMNNPSAPILLNNIYLDRFRPAITNVVLNNNSTYSSAVTGVNTDVVPIQFTADDFSYITHYTYSKHANVTFDASWTAVASNTTTINVSETVNIRGLGFDQGIQTFYVHAKDKFNNIGTAGVNFEFDDIPPVIRLSFADRIERAVVSGYEYFKIPYTLDFADNYSNVVYKYQKHEIGGNSSPELKVAYGFTQNAINLDYYYVPVGYHGDTKISISLEDRFRNKADFEDFTVFLENTAPVIHNGLINNGSGFTTNKDVFIEMDMSDDQGVTEVLFSTSNTETWNNPNWRPIPFAPRKSIVTPFTVDLDDIGFTEGTCNVQMYVKDFCQNVTKFSNTIVYDKYAPQITDFYVNNITRTIDSFEIELVGKAYDIVSGWNEYLISQSITSDVFKPVPGGPIIGSTPNTIMDIEHINVRDGGKKKIYFQTKDAAGNISEKANTEVYIDNVLPLAVHFTANNMGGSNYYLTRANNEFKYIVTDDFALAKIEYELNSNPAIIIDVFSQNNHVTYDAQSFTTNLTALPDGEHKIHLLVEDHFQNKIKVPYDFYIDNTPPTISKFDIKEIRPSFNGIANNYDVELDIKAIDNSGIAYYELYDNDQLITTVDVNNKVFEQTPTVVSVITITGSSANTGNANTNNANTLNSNTIISTTTQEHIYKIKVFDFAKNKAEATITKDLHNGTETLVNNFVINGNTSYTTTVVGNELFEANITSPVFIKSYALTIQPTIDYHSSFWIDFVGNSNNISFSVTEPLSNFSVNTLTGTSKIYLHVKDDCGNISNQSVDVFLTDSSPVISNLSSPVTLIRHGKYYVGSINFQINDPDSLIEAYAVGMTMNPSNFKSIPRTIAGTISHQIKIPEDQINGSEILYLQVRDSQGNLSNNYRVALRIVDFKFETFDIELKRYIVSSERVRVYFETETEPTEIKYGYQFDNNLEPIGWNSVGLLNRTDVGVYYFDFNINVSSLTSGEHTLAVWLKNGQDEKIMKTVEFVSEPTAVKPIAVVNVIKTEYMNNKKYVWVEAKVTDVGVGVQSISLTDNIVDNFETINTIQTKRIIKKFEYSKTDFRTILYRCKLVDAAGTPSITFTASVDLSYVY